MKYFSILFLLPFCLYADFRSAQYSDFSMEFDAINAGSAGAFLSTDLSINSIDNNPALLVLGYKWSYTRNYYKYDIVVPIEYYYNAISMKVKMYAIGLAYYDRKYSNFPAQTYSLALSSPITNKSTFGITLKYIHSKFLQYDANNFCAGIGYYSYNHFNNLSYKNDMYLKQLDFLPNCFKNSNRNISEGVSFGFSLKNIGPNVAFIETSKGDPMPQEINFGLSYSPVITNLISVKVGYNIEKDLVTSFPDRDIDGNGEIGGFDKNGNKDIVGTYSSNGKIEIAHIDKWYRSLITSWADEWFLLYDSGIDGIGEEDTDNNIKDGSFKKELNTIASHFGVEVSVVEWLGLRFGKIFNQFSTRNVNTWGISIGPDFLRYHYSNYCMIYYNSRYSKHDIQFHTIEFNYTPNFNNIINRVKN